ncbi:hypothetical protein F5Y10DRAFT_269718 [Nemania abortiva]|nr:hypothetical protein F5Y10DRAFT_269718 [Nemania abortiva]
MASASTEPVSPNIYHATNACRLSLQSCQSIKSLMGDGWAENRLTDFNIWASRLGASDLTQESLDCRLHYQPNVSVVLVGVLVALDCQVELCKDLGLRSDRGEDLTVPLVGDEELEVLRANSWSSEVAGDEDAVSEDASAWFIALSKEESHGDSSSTSEGDVENITTPLSEAMKDTEQILDQLIQLGLNIRESRTSSSLLKADKSFNKGDYQDLERHLGLILLAEADKQKNNQSKTTGERTIDPDKRYDDLTLDQKHIVTANLRRRHRFLYAMCHQKKLEEPSDTNAIEVTGQVTRASGSATPSQGPQPLAEARTEKQEVNRETGKAEMIDTTASAAEGSAFEAVETPPQAASRGSTTTAKMSYPSPPPVREGMKGFKCPCCHQMLPIMFRERSRWRKHVSEDLCPYTCPFSDCPRDATLYITRDDWKTHINEKHGSQLWNCLPCTGLEEPDTFPSEEEWLAHTRTRHQDIIKEDHIPNLREYCCKAVPPTIPSCPICFMVPQGSDPVGLERMLDHVGDCIHDFSLEALPWAESM